jgi:hypothetical protein
MLKPLLSLLLVSQVLFAYDIIIDKTLKAPKGAKPLEKKFIRDNIKETVYDPNTKLTWQDNSAAKTVKKNWQNAKYYCQNLNFASHNDWYLPTHKELLTITDKKRYKPSISIAFKNVTSSLYWSSSANVDNAKNAWYVLFNDGDSYYYRKADEYYVRCARSGQ